MLNGGNISASTVYDALGTVQDPDLGKDLVSLNMIRDLKIEGQSISFTLVLTTPACPLKDELKSNCLKAIHNLVSNDAVVKIEFDSNVTSKRIDKSELLPGVKNIICVASGKGGVGKSTVSVNLALGLVKNGAKVGLIDADIHGPSIPMMLGLKGARPTVQEVNGKHFMKPIEKHGLKILSIGFLVDEKQAVVWRGPMVASALKQFVTDCLWGDLDYLILDLPPGTGDIHLTLVQTVPVTGAVVVTTPQDIALADARKAIGMFRMNPVNVPVIGVVENMSWFTPEEFPDNKYFLFGEGGGEKIAEEYELPMLGQIPIVQSVREGGDCGEPIVLKEGHPTAEAFCALAENAAQQIAIRNATQEATQKVEIVT